MAIALTQEAPVIVPAVFSNKTAKSLTFFKAQSVVKHFSTVLLIWCVQSTCLPFSNPCVFCCSLLGLICYLNRLHLPFVMFCAIWYQLYNVKNVENTHGGVLLLVCNSTKNGTKSRNASHLCSYNNHQFSYTVLKFVAFKHFSKWDSSFSKWFVVCLMSVTLYCW